MVIDDTTFCFINIHIASGVKKNAHRLEQLLEIFKKGFVNEIKAQSKVNLNILIF